MSAQSATHLLVIGFTSEVLYKMFVRRHVRAYLGIETS
ncbi:MAG: hypothetical protein QOI03_2263 [Solirubrobacteraceae bacterium]|jgi:hypothetical protein|nr:hypothetical protein [Solirubrobacteraceae bacterium]